MTEEAQRARQQQIQEDAFDFVVTVQTQSLNGPKDNNEIQQKITSFIQETLGMIGAAVMVYICPSEQQINFEDSVNQSVRLSVQILDTNIDVYNQFCGSS